MGLVVKGISERRRGGRARDGGTRFSPSDASPWRLMLKMCNTVDEGGEEGVRYPVESSSRGGGGKGRHQARGVERGEAGGSTKPACSTRAKGGEASEEEVV